MRGKFYYLGKNVKLFTTHFGTEPYLISIHDNVVCVANVKFINHDISCFNMARYLGFYEYTFDKVGSIELFDNCFIGAYTILMPNCSVGRNSVIAAGSIVTKHVPDNEIWGGSPAKFIMTVDDYANRVKAKSEQYTWMPYEKKNSMTELELIKARQEHFFKNKN